MGGNFDQFYQVNRHKYTNVKHQIDLLEEQFEIKQDELQLHFGELKK